MKNLSLLILTLVSLFLQAQSPWLPSKNGFFVQASYTTIPEYSTLFTKSGDVFETSRLIKDKTLQVYGEYGISDKIALHISVPFKLLNSGSINQNFAGDLNQAPNASTENALGNIQTSVKYKLRDGKWVSAAQFRIELPASSQGEVSGLKPGYNAWAFSPLINIGRGWNKTYFFYYLSGIWRTNQYSTYLNTGIEGGWKAFNPIWLIFYSEFLNSFENGNKPLPPPEKQFGLYSNDLEYFSFGLKIIYETAVNEQLNLGLIAHASGSFSGFAVAHAPLVSLGLYLKK
ncbi:MAG: hypothetical protein R2750_08600 [Bacteroidales bacterium]